MNLKEYSLRAVRFLRKSLRLLICILGIFSLVMLGLAFTRVPYDSVRWLGNTGASYHFTPEYIIFLGGSGMPSESNLIRLYYVQKLSVEYPQAKVIIVHPSDSATVTEMSSFLFQMGIAHQRIFTMLRGTNTREQVLELKSAFKDLVNKKVVVVTSPENMYRTLKVFRRLDFLNIGGAPAYENAMFVNLGYNYKKVGGKKFIPDVSSSMNIRYDLWNYLKLEITCMREYLAIIYYKLNGWI